MPKLDAEYVARMEDVLALYAEPPDSKRPIVCFDETPVRGRVEPRKFGPADGHQELAQVGGAG